MPPPPPYAPTPRNHIFSPRKSPFFLNLYKQVSEEKEIDKRKVSFTLYPLSFRFNKIDLNCYVFLPLTNDKQFYFCAVFSFFYFKYKYSQHKFQSKFGCSECRKWHFRVSNFNNFLMEYALRLQYSCLVCRSHTWPSAIAIIL